MLPIGDVVINSIVSRSRSGVNHRKAKGGVIKRQLGLPVRLIGIGEKIDDLKDFNSEVFVEALFSEVGTSETP